MANISLSMSIYKNMHSVIIPTKQIPYVSIIFLISNNIIFVICNITLVTITKTKTDDKTFNYFLV